MSVFERLGLAAMVVLSSVMPVLAQPGHGWGRGGSGGGGGRGVPEIDASAGIATLAVLATIGIITYSRRQK